MLTTELQQWEKGGRYLEIGPSKIKVFVRDLAKEDASPEKTLLLLHGFPESSYSYHKIIP